VPISASQTMLHRGRQTQRQTHVNQCRHRSRSPQNEDREPMIVASVDLSDQQVTVLTFVNYKPVKAYVDTGAQISCMANDLYREKGFHKTFPMGPSKVKAVRGVGGAKTRVLGQTKLTLSIAGLLLVHTVYVLETATYPFILGVDFLREQKAHIRFDDNTLVLQSGMTQVKLNESIYDSTQPVLSVLQKTVLQPGCETVVPLQTNVSVPDQLVLVEPVQNLSDRNILGANCVACIEGGRTVGRFLNTTNACITFTPDQVVARLSTIAPAQIVGDFQESEFDYDAMSETDKQCYRDIAKDLNTNIGTSHLSDTERDKLLVFIGMNRDVFAKDISELGTTSFHSHNIDTGDSSPIAQNFYRQTPKLHEETARQVEEMLNNGIIQPSTSPWTSPVVLVKKQDGSFRFTVDYRN
jgi:hypothetical protein